MLFCFPHLLKYHKRYVCGQIAQFHRNVLTLNLEGVLFTILPNAHKSEKMGSLKAKFREHFLTSAISLLNLNTTELQKVFPHIC